VTIIENIKARLIEDWRQAGRWWSVRWNAVGIVVQPLMLMVPSMPPEIQALFPLPVRLAVAGLWSAVAIYFRVYRQKPGG
jgi:hypothetical protein